MANEPGYKLIQWTADKAAGGRPFSLRVRAHPMTREIAFDLNTHLYEDDGRPRTLNYSNLTIDAARQVIEALEAAIAAVPPPSPEQQIRDLHSQCEALQAKLERIRQIATQSGRFVTDVLHEIRAEVSTDA